MFNIFNFFHKNKKYELTEEDLKWNKMWDLWTEDEIESPYKELMKYQSEIYNGGHSQYFTNVENTSDIKVEMEALIQILPKKLSDNLSMAYKAYMDLELNECDEKAESIIEDCEDLFYDSEDEITAILKEYASRIKL